MTRKRSRSQTHSRCSRPPILQHPASRLPSVSPPRRANRRDPPSQVLPGAAAPCARMSVRKDECVEALRSIEDDLWIVTQSRVTPLSLIRDDPDISSQACACYHGEKP